jgi:cytochrome c2
MDTSKHTTRKGEQSGGNQKHPEVNVRVILGFGIGLVILGLITYILIVQLFEHFAIREAKETQPLPPLIAKGAKKPEPPDPRLQSSPTQDMTEMRVVEEAILNNYSWVDQKAGIVRIPIEQAIKLVAQRGLPVRPKDKSPGEGGQGQETPKEQEWIKQGIPEDSSAGRTIRGNVYKVVIKPFEFGSQQTTTQTDTGPGDRKSESAGTIPPGSPAAEGEKLFQDTGCNVCHKIGVKGRGPDLTGIFGKPVKLKSGETITADETYMRESILSPQAKVVEGFGPIMPPYEGKLSEEDVTKLVEYIKALGSK